MITWIDGGVCAAKGYKANGIHCGIRKNKEKKDLSLIVSDVPAAAAAVYTTNLVKGAPLVVTKQHLANGTAQAIVCNSGNANTCNANGIEIAEQMSRLAADAVGIAPDDVVVASTGVIGQPLEIAPIATGMPALAAGLSDTGSADAAACADCNRHAGACRRAARHRKRRRGGRDYDDRHGQEGSGRVVYPRRQNLPSRRHCQGQRHDPPEYGDDAGVYHNRRFHQRAAAATGAVGRYCKHV